MLSKKGDYLDVILSLKCYLKKGIILIYINPNPDPKPWLEAAKDTKNHVYL